MSDLMVTVILPATAGNLAFAIVILTSFIRTSVPVELEEAAYIEGYNLFQIFFRIVIPLSKSGLMTVGIFSFNTVLTASDYRICVGAEADDDIAKAQDAVALLQKLSLTCNWFADQGDGRFTLTTNSNAEHKVDDLTRGGQVLRAKYYSVKGKLTLANAGDWGQARILVSADAKNEYFIALEKTNTGKYQIFTMSKANQTGWDAWELILHQDTNGTRNSIDFEILVIGNKLYFLIEDQVVYTSTRVPMTESTVKFTGYNTATTTVENLSAEVFASKQEAEAYLADKSI